MPDYSKGKIYKILNYIDDEIYVGSTTETLGQRMAKHRANLKINPHLKLFEHMHKLGVEHFYIELIENYSCNDIYELRAREGFYIREIGTLNQVIAGRTKQEYYKDNSEHLEEAHKRWVENNKEHLKEVKKQYYENNKEHLKEANKRWQENNKEHIKEVKKQYHDNNKEHLEEAHKRWVENNKKYVYEKITCDMCGCQVNRNNIATHRKTLKCKSRRDTSSIISTSVGSDD